MKFKCYDTFGDELGLVDAPGDGAARMKAETKWPWSTIGSLQQVFSKTQILKDQGWIELRDNMWQPPTNFSAYSEKDALEIANDPKFKEILKLLG